MEISPITGIRAMPVMKTPPADTDLSRVLEAEDSSGPGDDTYTGNGKKAGGGQDDETEELEGGAEVEAHGQVVGPVADGSIDYFA